MRKAVALKSSGYFAFTLELASHRISSVIHKSKGSRVLMRTLGLPAVLPAHARCVHTACPSQGGEPLHRAATQSRPCTWAGTQLLCTAEVCTSPC